MTTITPEDLIRFAADAALRGDLPCIAVPPTAVPCPDWCGHEPGHGYELEDAEGRDQRYHTMHFDRGTASVDVGALATWHGDHEEVGDLDIACFSYDTGDRWTAQQAADHAEAFAAAAQWLNEWQEAQR